MNQFKREHVQVDIPTLEIVPQDAAERASWEARRQRFQASREANAEAERKLSEERMENLRRFEADQKRPFRRFMRWIGL